MGLAGDDDLDRPVGIGQQLLQPVRVAQHQGQPLVGRHPAGEAEGDDVRAEHAGDPVAGEPAVGAALGQPGPGHLDQLTRIWRLSAQMVFGSTLCRPAQS